MNYFINTQGSLIFFIESLIVIIILATLFTISVLAIKYFHLSEKVIKILLVIIIPLILFFSFTNKILDPYHQGVVRELFIFNDNNQTLLSVWLTRTHTKRFAADYNQRIQTFDIESGLSLGAMEIAKKHYSNDYRLYWNGENEAWGYQPKTNEQENQIHAINLAKPELVSTQDALPQPEPTIKEGWPLRIDYLDRPGWKFQFVSENIGEKILGPEGQLSSQSTILLDPNFIEELNAKTGIKNKIWISHKSAILGDYEKIISYVDSNGQEINKINLNELFAMDKIESNCENINICDEMIQSVATYTRDDEILIFITRGENYLSNNSGFTLTALRTNKKTGELLGQIDYIK